MQRVAKAALKPFQDVEHVMDKTHALHVAMAISY